MHTLFYIIPLFGILALLFTLFKSIWVTKRDAGTDKMKSIAGHITEGAMALLKVEYKVLSIFVISVAILLAVSANAEVSSPIIAVSFLIGAFCSALAGFIGLKVATKANVRTTNAARTGLGKRPVRAIARQSLTGSATNIISGLSTDMISTALPIIILAASILLAISLAGLYGIAIAAVGMLSNTGIQLAVDAYGPISDNAGGIAEMSELPKEVRQRTDKLDAVGNTTAAIGKGFAIGAAALTVLALFGAYMTSAGIKSIDISKAPVMAGLFLGAMLPFLFSALAVSAVGQAAMAMIEEGIELKWHTLWERFRTTQGSSSWRYRLRIPRGHRLIF